ncbi:Mitochondrial fission protein ELM1 [Zea mays]|uniref:Mitochondrial fission protein ELM1 n=1 Tax=Zea mays TaxID=4577 RepID=A0A3L6FEY3_MAIZE|nr:Mitochondrial fission protein ELM1 [Zea mays]
MTFTEKMVLVVFRDLIILWMTKRLMDDIHGWGVLFDGRVGDRTITVYIWNGEEPKPNKGHLAWADAFVITADSISMLSEACSIGLILKNVASLFMNKDSLKVETDTRLGELIKASITKGLEKFFAIMIFSAKRYQSFDSEIGALIEDGKADFEMLKKKVLECGALFHPASRNWQRFCFSMLYRWCDVHSSRNKHKHALSKHAFVLLTTG